MLATLAAQMANLQVRNQGTLGGNLCYGDPATDPPGCLLALDASVVLGSARRARVLPLAEFLVDFYTTALEPDELLVEVRLPPPAADSDGATRAGGARRPSTGRWSTCRCTFGVMSRVMAGAAARRASSSARARRWRGASPGPRPASSTARSMPRVWPRSRRSSPATSTPSPDARGDAAYRRRIARVATQRTLQELFGLAAG